MKRKKNGFTLVELLTVLAIIALLTGLLIPAMNMVRRVARETKQNAQFTTIALGLTAFKNDYGDYPPSDWVSPDLAYCGAQKLAEALLGWDLMGFHPDSEFTSDGWDKATPSNQIYISDDEYNLKDRRGHYIELTTANAFRLGNDDDEPGLFNNTGLYLARNTFVICDSFGVRKLKIGGKVVKAGTPILYYRANTSSKNLNDSDLSKRIYDARDNSALVRLRKVTKDGKSGESHDGFWSAPDDYKPFYDFDEVGGIKDSQITVAMNPTGWPHRPDSYILISAGEDGEYGTRDDIRNFGQ